jgi:hypothetical protein
MNESIISFFYVIDKTTGEIVPRHSDIVRKIVFYACDISMISIKKDCMFLIHYTNDIITPLHYSLLQMSNNEYAKKIRLEKSINNIIRSNKSDFFKEKALCKILSLLDKI